jgi:very-short-patch-repair endonuclease
VSNYVILVLVLVVVLVIGAALKASRGKGLAVVPRRLMTPRERQVLLLIEAAAPYCRVHSQVSMGALLDCRKGTTAKQRASIRNRFDRKRIDFVLEERSSGDVLALIELDDATHNAAKDRVRDGITGAAGYRTIRLPSGKRLDATSVREEINAILLPQAHAEAALAV